MGDKSNVQIFDAVYYRVQAPKKYLQIFEATRVGRYQWTG
jgi:hypothetical protein